MDGSRVARQATTTAETIAPHALSSATIAIQFANSCRGIRRGKRGNLGGPMRIATEKETDAVVAQQRVKVRAILDTVAFGLRGWTSSPSTFGGS